MWPPVLECLLVEMQFHGQGLSLSRSGRGMNVVLVCLEPEEFVSLTAHPINGHVSITEDRRCPKDSHQKGFLAGH